MQVLLEVAEPAMFNLTRLTMQNEQTRQVSLRRGRLRDQLPRQLKIKIRSSHVAGALCQCSNGARRQVQGAFR